LESGNERKKSLDPIYVKKRLENYDQMLQHYTFMKMKDFDVESKEWWEVAKEYFYKELEKILAHHRANERAYMYKLEAYQITFLDFVCGSPTSIEASCQDEENEAWPNGTTQKEEVQVEETQILEGGGQENKEP
jgi:6-pyruvoyl-tetrahydropterin synthase